MWLPAYLASPDVNTRGCSLTEHCRVQVLRPLNAPVTGDNESSEELAFRSSVQLPCLLNIAACRIKLMDLKLAIEACDKAIKMDPTCTKV